MNKSAERHLCRCDPIWAPLLERVGPCTLRPAQREPYEALIRAVSHQQLHGRAAETILGRFVALQGADFPDPVTVLSFTAESMRACGFSFSKVAAIQDIAAKTLDGTVPTALAAAGMSDDELIARLVGVRGVGRWTVEMLLISTLGRPDVLPVDDFGVREGWRLLTGAEAQLKPRELAQVGAAWSPYRTTAAWYLWRASDEGKKLKQPPLPGG